MGATGNGDVWARGTSVAAVESGRGERLRCTTTTEDPPATSSVTAAAVRHPTHERRTGAIRRNRRRDGGDVQGRRLPQRRAQVAQQRKLGAAVRTAFQMRFDHRTRRLVEAVVQQIG